MASAIKMTSDWREQLGDKLVTPDEAVAHIKSGDRITASIAHVTPFTLFHALAGRLMELERVVINYSAALFAFDLPGLGDEATRVVQNPTASKVQSAVDDVLELWNAKASSQGYVNSARSFLSVIRFAYVSSSLLGCAQLDT
jgi:acyl-CoA hydrolase